MDPAPVSPEIPPLRLVDGLTTLEQPLYRMGISLGHRMTIVQLADGGLVLHSPIERSDALLARLHELGEIRAIVVPSLMHDLWLEPWFEALPHAIKLGPRMLRQAHPALTLTHELEEHPALFAPELPAMRLEGMPRVQEWVFHHRASRTLIAADLLFDRRGGHRHAGRVLARIFGLHRGPGVSRLFRSFIRDRKAFLASLERVLAADWERLVIGHGEPIEHGARDLLRAIFDL